jgi:hypothetical protein
LWSLVNAVMNFGVPQHTGNYLTEYLLDSQEGIWSTELFIYLSIYVFIYLLLFVRRTKHHARTTSRVI